jgi:diaminopimelate epimerase
VLDRHFGVGGDQLLLVQPSSVADFRMGIRNADGSQAEMCGNGIRCFLKYVRDRGHTDREAVRVETLGGIVTPRWLGDGSVEIEMTRPVLDPEKIPTRLRGDPPLLEVPLRVEGRTLQVTPVSMGNPHCVVFVDDPDAVPIERLGPALEQHPDFPSRANVEFVATPSRSEIRQRTWERGVGETLACGSGACAAVVAAVLAGRVERDVRVRLRGGELRVRWPAPDAAVFLAGPAVHVFDGEIEVE